MLQYTPASPNAVTKGAFMVAILNEYGYPIFSSKPKVYMAEKEAAAEVERLARSAPGKTFVYFQCKGVAVANGVTWS